MSSRYFAHFIPEGEDTTPTGNDSGSGADDASVDAPRQTADSGTGTDAAWLDTPTPDDAAVGADSAYVTKIADTAVSACGPYSGPVQILYDGIDITACVLLESASFKSAANGTVGTCNVRVKDTGHQFDFVSGRSLVLKVNGSPKWGGYVGKVRLGFFFTGSIEAPGDVVRYFELQGVDYNVLFQKRVLFDKVTPTNLQLTTFPANTDDDDVIRSYIDNHLDLSGDGLSTAGIEHVGTPSQDDEISGNAGWSWGQLLRFLRFNTGAIDYIRPDKVIVHTDVDTPTSTKTLTDVPDGVNDVGYRELEIEFNGQGLRNDALIWGLGHGSPLPVFSRIRDEASIAEHGLWQVGRQMLGAWIASTVDRAANSQVYGSPQSKRGGKDDAKAVQLTTFDDSFTVGQKVPFESQVWDYSDVLPIRSMEIDFPTPTDARFRLTLSHEIDDPWSSIDPFNYSFDFPDFPDLDIPELWIPELWLPPWNFCAAAFVDNFDDRVIPRTTHKNEDDDPSGDDFGPTDVIAWGVSSDGEHQWHVNQLKEEDYNPLTGAESSLGGFGVGSSFLGRPAGFMVFDVDNFLPHASWAQIDYKQIAAIWEGDWTFETVVHFNHHDTFGGGSNVTLDIIVADYNVSLEVEFDPYFPYSTLSMSEAGTSYSGDYDTPDLTLGFGIPWHIKWEHFPSTGVARAKIWNDNTAEPGWQVTDDVYDYRAAYVGELAGPPRGGGGYGSFNPDLVLGPNSNLEVGSDPTDYVRFDYEYIRIYSPGLVDCIDLNPPRPDPPMNPLCETMTFIADPAWLPSDYVYFEGTTPFRPHLARVWRNGRLLRLGVDYLEYPSMGVIGIVDEIGLSTDTIYVCYIPERIAVGG